MIEELLKDKKKVGILILLVITIVIIGIVYINSGYKELRKNDTESIFTEDTTANSNINDNKQGSNKNSSSKNNIKQSKAESVSNVDKNNEDKSIVVEIKGEVRKPDVYTLHEDAIVRDLIEMAGGLTENADLTNINRAKKLQNHDLIYIENKNGPKRDLQNMNTSIGNGVNSNGKVNINTATADELKKLSGIGEVKAKNILDYRQKSGNFNSIEDIKNVTGITDKIFEKIKEQLEV